MSGRQNSVTQFLNSVISVVEEVGTETIKESIGDSTRNNRVVTVNQLIRYLSGSSSRSRRTLGRKLAVVYGSVRPNVRFAINNRTDAIDLTEFSNYITLCSNFVDFNRSVAQRLANA